MIARQKLDARMLLTTLSPNALHVEDADVEDGDIEDADVED